MKHMLMAITTGVVLTLGGMAIAADAPTSGPAGKGMHARHRMRGAADGATSRPAGKCQRVGGRMHAFAQKLEMTDAQKEQARAIFQQARQDAVKAADRAAKKDIWQAAREKVRTTVLTAEQVKKLDELKAQRHKGAGGPATTTRHPRGHGGRSVS